MRVIRTTIAAAALLVAATAAASAQTPAAGRPAATPARPAPATVAAPQGGSATIAEGKFAVIETESFLDEKQGIRRLIAAYQTLNREFKPRFDELQTLKTRYDAIIKQANDTAKVADQKSLDALSDQAAALKLEIEQKQAVGKLAIDKRERELTEPINQDIGNALRAFARARGVSVVFDISKMANVVLLVNEKDSVNITDAFIAEYNQRNPASTASTTAPGNQ